MSRIGRVERTGRLGSAYDLLAAYESGGVVFEHGGLGVAGWGIDPSAEVALSVEEPATFLHRSFDGLPSERGAPPPVMLVSIPFDPSAPATAIVPRSTVRRDRAGETWRLGSEPERTRRSVGRGAPHEAFAELQLRPHPTPEIYEQVVARTVERIGRGELRKVVLARTLEVAAGRVLDPKQLAWRLRAVDPDAFTFAFPFGSPDPRVLVGASPELLVRRAAREVVSRPLAGSAPRSGDPVEDRASGERLLASAKDREEHAVVVEDVATRLGPFCETLAHDPEPVLLGTANVWHLCTRFRGTLQEPAADALTLALALHPTPAVGGSPRAPALQTIAELEPFERGGYAGPIGWVDAAGDGEFAIALRCAELRGDRATLYSGAGIVAGSVPELELDETERKFRAFLDSLRWG